MAAFSMVFGNYIHLTSSIALISYLAKTDNLCEPAKRACVDDKSNQYEGGTAGEDLIDFRLTLG